MELHDQCVHEVFLEGKCANCKAGLIDCKGVETVPVDYLRPGGSMRLATTFIDRFRDQDLKNTLGHKKLSLILDLDNTLIIHAKRKKKLSSQDKQRVTINKVYKNRSRLVMLRPGATEFVREVESMFDLSIYTMGTRDYAYDMAELLASDTSEDVRSVFGRIISREDCTKSKEKSLDIVLSHKLLVLIVDDKEDVWEESCRGNIIKIDPYYFFSDAYAKEIEGCNNNSNGSCNETGMDEELKRVLGTLRAVQSMFYAKKRGCMKNDVRQTLERVRVNEAKSKQEEEESRKHKMIQDEKNRKFIEKFCAPLKKYETDVPIGGSIHV